MNNIFIINRSSSLIYKMFKELKGLLSGLNCSFILIAIILTVANNSVAAPDSHDHLSQREFNGPELQEADVKGVNVVLINDIEAVPGNQIVVEVEIDNEDIFLGFNMDIRIPEGFSYVEGSGQLFRQTNHVFFESLLEGGSLLRVVAFSISNDAFIGNEGLLFSFELDTPLVPGQYAINIEDAVFANLEIPNILTDTVDGVVTLGEENPADLNIAGTSDISVTDVECFFALNNIFVAGEGYTFTVAGNGEATLAAGQSIKMLPGTIVESGGYLMAYITAEDPCGRPFATEELPAKDEVINPIDVVDENDGSLFFTLYPNPALSEVYIEMGGLNNESDVTIEVYSLMGERVYSEQVPAQKSFVLNLLEQQAGVYIVRIIQDNKVAVERLIKR